MKVKCPVCGSISKWANNKYRPFCSERCWIVDLGTWASEGYRISGKKITAETEPREKNNCTPSSR